MTKKTMWSHLPNADHIDRVIASVKDHPKVWAAAPYVAGYMVARASARDAAQHAARTEVWDAVWVTAGYMAQYASRYAARNAVVALVAYDDCAHYLDMPSDQLRVWAILSEKPAAILMLPAVTAFEKISLLEMV